MAGTMLILLGSLLAVAFYHLQKGGFAFGPFKVLFGADLVIVIAFFAAAFYVNSTFDGAIDSRYIKWPRFIFAVLCGLSICLHFLATALGIDEFAYKIALPSTFVSVMLIWYGFSMLFGTFFLGPGAAIFFVNPISWLRYLNTRRGR